MSAKIRFLPSQLGALIAIQVMSDRALEPKVTSRDLRYVTSLALAQRS